VTAVKLPSRTRLNLAVLLWFLIWIALQAYGVFQSESEVYSTAIDTAFSCGLLLLGLVFLYSIQRYAGSYFNQAGIRLGFTTVIVGAIVYLQVQLLPFIYASGSELIYGETVLLRFMVTLSVVSFFEMVQWLIHYTQKKEARARQKKEAEDTLREAELIMLRQQLQPHFLFNSLNSVNSLVITEPKKAREMILNLSDFLRGTLKKDETKTVSLAEEMKLLKLYLEIEKVRFGHRLRIRLDIPDEATRLKLPPLLLQPVVENAIKFGLYNMLEEVQISVSAQKENNLLKIEITNPFDASAAQMKKGEGFGLSLIQKRLLLLYRRADLLSIRKTESLFTTVILIPQV
jgi:two-component system, LytTR family, sensor kinase